MQQEVNITRWKGEAKRECLDTVAMEEPLELRIHGESLTVTMRTPGDDFALCAGLLFAEGIIRSGWDIQQMGYGQESSDPDWRNVVDARLKYDWNRQGEAGRWERNLIANAGCGVCGKANLAAVRTVIPPIPASDLRVSLAVIRSLPDRMRAAQRVFERTGGLHAAGLFDAQGTLLSLKEDIGRHNAVDKLIGGEVMANRTPLTERLLLVSGRAGYEILQKAAVAQIPILCSVSAPSSLAVQMARDLNMTLIGFLRGETMNVYAGAERIG